MLHCPKPVSAPDPERDELVAKLRTGTVTAAEKKRFDELQSLLAEMILHAPLAELFAIKNPPPQIPAPARIHQSIICQVCGEEVMATRIQLVEGKRLCIPCSEML